MNDREKFRFEFYLSRLGSNLPGGAVRPGLDETLASYRADAGLRARIAALAETDAVSRFYAAVLLAAVERDAAQRLFPALEGDKTLLKVSKSIGFGLLEMPLDLLARDFLEDEDFPGGHFRRTEALTDWRAAIATEKRRGSTDFDETWLPRYADALEAESDAEKAAVLRAKVERLKAGSAAERFYAAALLQTFDADEARAILEDLLDEPAPVGVLRGDLMIEFPASEIAAELLGRGRAEENAVQTPLRRFFKWLGG